MPQGRGCGSPTHTHMDRRVLATGFPKSPAAQMSCHADSKFEFTFSAWTPRTLVCSNMS